MLFAVAQIMERKKELVKKVIPNAKISVQKY